MSTKQLICAALFFCSLSSFANEKVLDNETTVFDETFSWQLMASASATYNPSLLKGQDQEEIIDYTSASLLLDVYYEGFFIQSNHQRPSALLTGAEIGYQLVVTPKWEIDIISKVYIEEYRPNSIIRDAGKDIPTLNGLKNRENGKGLGVRYTRYHRNAALSVDFATLNPLSSANGWVFDVFYSYLIPYRNWDIYLSTGLTRYSEKVMDYYYGVNSDEVTPARALHQAKAGYRVQFELFAQHPLTEAWSFTGGITQTRYSSSIKDSPLVDTQNLTQVMLGVLYVF